MRLTVKLLIGFLACVLVAVGLNGFFAVRAELERYEADLASRHVVMGLVLRSAFSEVMDTDGEARAVSVLDYTDKRMRLVDVRWVHLEAGAPPERTPFAPLAELAPVTADRPVHHKAGGRLWTYVAVHIQGRAISALEFSETLDDRAVVRRAVLRELRSVAAIALAIGAAAAGLGVLLVARPMRRLVDHARRIGRGDLSVTEAPGGRDEIAQLGREMNAMCAQLADAQDSKLKALEQLRHAERLTTVGQLASGLAHELGTPLNVITLRAKAVMSGRAVGERAQEAGKSIVDQATRVADLVRQLLDFARRRVPERNVVDLPALVRRTLNLVEPIARKAQVRVSMKETAESLRVRGDAGQLEQVLTNLLLNAVQAMPEGGEAQVELTARTVTPPADHGGPRAEYVEIAVVDHGTGITEQDLGHIFEPFFTTKGVGVGTGLGLAVCYGIVRDHGGWIDVTTAIGRGSTFTVHLPERQA